MTCCAWGPCDRSKDHGGEGCYLCDVIARLPQPDWRRKPVRPPRVRKKKDRDTKDLTYT